MNKKLLKLNRKLNVNYHQKIKYAKIKKDRNLTSLIVFKKLIQVYQIY